MDLSKIDQYAKIGMSGKDWYGQSKNYLSNIFPESDIDLVCDILAVTSIHTTLQTNVSHTIKAYYQYKNNLPFEGYLPVVIDQLEGLRNGQELSGRKISNFAAALKGNPSAVVVDLWICRAFGIDRDTPTTKQYDFIEDYMRVRCLKYGLEPRQFQAAVWVGIRGKGNYCQFFDSKIRTDLFSEKIEFGKKYIYI